MKAIIIYDDIGCALKATHALRNADGGEEGKGACDIHLWRLNILRFRSMAGDALKEAVKADLIVFAVSRRYLLPAWLKNWLEQWAARREVKDAALGLVEDATEGSSLGTHAIELSDFAARHNLVFIAGNENRRRDVISNFPTAGSRFSNPPYLCASASCALTP